MLLENKNAVIYGAGGGIGAGVATTFAREGARVFLAGRTRDKLDLVAKDIEAAGGRAEVAVVDALDERAVDEHARAVAAEAGSLDVSFNLVSRGDVQGVPLAGMTTADFLRPITTGITTNFITARTAARHMTEQRSGVILALDSGSAHGSPMMGGTGPADAATDTFIRNLAAEIGPSGVRVLGLWAAGIPETLTSETLSTVNSNMVLDDTAIQGLLENLAQMRMLRRSPRLAEVAAVAAFLASDRATGITGTFVNVTGGIFPSYFENNGE
jgi:NAD(P)-dependent dehydrogenase (short-subunit alcohol dehydrogenase family)